jgi:hypothetical protein
MNYPLSIPKNQITFGTIFGLGSKLFLEKDLFKEIPDLLKWVPIDGTHI